MRHAKLPNSYNPIHSRYAMRSANKICSPAWRCNTGTSELHVQQGFEDAKSRITSVRLTFFHRSLWVAVGSDTPFHLCSSSGKLDAQEISFLSRQFSETAQFLFNLPMVRHDVIPRLEPRCAQRTALSRPFQV